MRAKTISSRRGIRIGLVMNGGVSLAVWMGGVARELHAAAVASDLTQVRASDEPAEDDPVDRLWAILLARAGVEIDIDVVAGSSAGGLNGTILASCLAQGADFPKLREVWVTLGQISRGRLLRRIDHQQDADAPRPSLFDGAFFEEQVQEQFSLIEQSSNPLQRRAVECLVTATAIGSAWVPMRDDYGRAQQYVDSRRLYRFAHASASWKYDPVSDTYGAADSGNDFTDSLTTARAARASCSFPVAFAPVPESVALQRRRWDAARARDETLTSLGTDLALLPRTWLMDGGVLDNAPFEPVLDAIRRRPIDGPWRRVLAYVVPSGAVSPVPDPPKNVETGSDETLPGQPGVARVLGAVVGAWGESDARLDAEALQRHRASASRIDFTAERLIEEARELDAAKSPSWLDAAPPLFDSYRARRLRALETGTNPDATWLVPDSLAVDPARWNWGDAVALRVLRWWGRELNRLGVGAEAISGMGEVQARADAVSEAITRLHEEVAVRRASTEGPEAEGTGSSLDPRVANSLASLRWLMLLGAQRYAAAVRGVPSPGLDAPLETGTIEAEAAEHLRRALAVEVVTFAGSSGAENDTPPFSYLRMAPDVESPATPDGVGPRLGWWGSAKLYGTALNHFAGFIDERWRLHDWTWGRLDAVAHLVKLVVAESEVIPEADKPQVMLDWQTRLQEAVLRAEEQPALSEWTTQAASFAEHGGATNEMVLESVHGTPQGHALMSECFDEALGLITTLADERSPRAGGIGQLVRHSLYLETPRPTVSGSRRGAAVVRLLTRRPRRGIRDWIRGR